MYKIVRSILIDKVLDDTMDLFWKKGLLDTSIEELVDTTRLNRAALYKYFKDKDGLFLAMLQRYHEQIVPLFISPLQREPKGINGIIDFFTNFLLYCETENAAKGCFIIATSANIHIHDEKVAEFIAAFLSELRQLFLANLLNAQIAAEVSNELDCHACADFLVGNVFGFWTLLRAKAPLALIKNHLQGVLDYLSNCQINVNKV